jgi:hypothetical protein
VTVADFKRKWARSARLKVSINDKGEYWLRRRLKALQKNLGELNCAVAAAAGALNDAADAGGQPGVLSRIFNHPQFEKLEAAGAARGHAARLREVVE